MLHTVRRARILIRELRESNLVISEKTVVLANRKSTRLEIVRKLAREGLVCGHGLAAKDLGVGIALGRGRCTGVLKHRIKSTRGRVGRIKVLRRTHPRAAKLVNTGAMPQATFGKEVCGVSPGDMSKLRAFAAQAVSTSSKGQCATTLIILNLGRNYDPQVKCVVDQVRNWLWIYGTLDGAEKLRTVRAWRKCNEHLMKAINGEPQPFRRVRGPMGATIAMLHEIRWKTGGPGVWTDREGCTWRYDAGSPACLIRAIRQHAELKV